MLNSNEIKWGHFRGGPTLIQQNDFSKETFPSTYQSKHLLVSIPSLPIIKETQEATFYIKLNWMHTYQGFKTPIREWEISWRYLWWDPGPNLNLSQRENFSMINHSTFKLIVISVPPYLTNQRNPQVAHNKINWNRCIQNLEMFKMRSRIHTIDWSYS